MHFTSFWQNKVSCKKYLKWNDSRGISIELYSKSVNSFITVRFDASANWLQTEISQIFIRITLTIVNSLLSISVHSVSKLKRSSDREEGLSYGIGKCLVEEGIIVLSGSCKLRMDQTVWSRIVLDLKPQIVLKVPIWNHLTLVRRRLSWHYYWLQRGFPQ